MPVIVLGAGQVGFHLVKNLQMESVPVTVIDKEGGSLKHLSNLSKVKIIKGEGQSIEELKKAGVERSRLLFAALPKDTQNILSCLLAKKINPNIVTVARIRNSNLLNAKYLYKNKVIPIDIPINPEYSTAIQVLDLLQFKNTRELVYLMDRKIVLRGMLVTKDSPLNDKTVLEIKEKYDLNMMVIAISRENHTIIPFGTDKILEGDTIHIMMLSEDEDRVLKTLKYCKNKIKNVIVVGGGSYGMILAREFVKRKISCRLIEENRAKAQSLDSILSKVIIINGDGTDRNILKENQVQKMDSVISMTTDGFTNIVTASQAKEMGAKNTISLTFSTSLLPLSYTMGIDICLNPRYAAINEVLTKVYSENVKSVQIIANESAEIVEITITDSLKIANKPLKKIKAKERFLIGLIERNGNHFIPAANDQLLDGDKVLVFALKEDIHDILEKYFMENVEEEDHI